MVLSSLYPWTMNAGMTGRERMKKTGGWAKRYFHISMTQDYPEDLFLAQECTIFYVNVIAPTRSREIEILARKTIFHQNCIYVVVLSVSPIVLSQFCYAYIFFFFFRYFNRHLYKYNALSDVCVT